MEFDPTKYDPVYESFEQALEAYRIMFGENPKNRARYPFLLEAYRRIFPVASKAQIETELETTRTSIFECIDHRILFKIFSGINRDVINRKTVCHDIIRVISKHISVSDKAYLKEQVEQIVNKARNFSGVPENHRWWELSDGIESLVKEILASQHDAIEAEFFTLHPTYLPTDVELFKLRQKYAYFLELLEDINLRWDESYVAFEKHLLNILRTHSLTSIEFLTLDPQTRVSLIERVKKTFPAEIASHSAPGAHDPRLPSIVRCTWEQWDRLMKALGLPHCTDPKKYEWTKGRRPIWQARYIIDRLSSLQPAPVLDRGRMNYGKRFGALFTTTLACGKSMRRLRFELTRPENNPARKQRDKNKTQCEAIDRIIDEVFATHTPL